MMHNTINVPTNHQIPTTQERAQRLRDQAETWTRFVLQRARMRPATVQRKAGECLRFALDNRARAFCVPSKLAGTSHYQDALATLHELSPMRGHRLNVSDDGERIQVAFAGMVLGNVQRKHEPWLRPLLTCGATVHYLQVTGTERMEGFYGCNIAFGHVAAAVRRVTAAGESFSSDGAADVDEEAPRVSLADVLRAETAGVWTDLTPLSALDVLLWREQGEARTNVLHRVRHSPTGIEWGSLGAGASDLAYSILAHVACEDVAQEHAFDFKNEVVARMPQAGGRITRTFVRRWLAEQSGPERS